MRKYVTSMGRLFWGLVQGRGSLAVAAESMWALNTFARQSEDKELKRWIYALKNNLVQVLYQRGYCVHLTRSFQRQECWGTRNYGCGPHCPKCGGTGIFRENELYTFYFQIGGRRYSWHQPGDLVNWPVQLTDRQVDEYKPPPERTVKLTNRSILGHSFIVWWALKLRRLAPEMPYFRPLRPVYAKWEYEEEDDEGVLWHNGSSGRKLYLFSFYWERYVRPEDSWWSFQWPVTPGWGIRSYHAIFTWWHPKWLAVEGRRTKSGHYWTVFLGGKSWPEIKKNLRQKWQCFREGHDWKETNWGRYCGRCYFEEVVDEQRNVNREG